MSAKGFDAEWCATAHPRNAWLLAAVSKQLREEFAKLRASALFEIEPGLLSKSELPLF
jgi:hypothetical protein